MPANSNSNVHEMVGIARIGSGVPEDPYSKMGRGSSMQTVGAPPVKHRMQIVDVNSIFVK